MAKRRQESLPDRVRDVTHLKHWSISMEQASVSRISRFALLQDRRHTKRDKCRRDRGVPRLPVGRKCSLRCCDKDKPTLRRVGSSTLARM